jgi:PAS domain S-box-containing protein
MLSNSDFFFDMSILIEQHPAPLSIAVAATGQQIFSNKAFRQLETEVSARELARIFRAKAGSHSVPFLKEPSKSYLVKTTKASNHGQLVTLATLQLVSSENGTRGTVPREELLKKLNELETDQLPLKQKQEALARFLIGNDPVLEENQVDSKKGVHKKAQESRELAVANLAGVEVLDELSSAVAFGFSHLAVNEAVQQAQRHLQDLVDTFPIPVFVHSAGQVHYANQVCGEYDEKIDPTENISLDQIMASKALLTHFELVKKSQAKRSVIVSLPTQAGTIRQFEVTTLPTDYDGEPALLTIARNEHNELRSFQQSLIARDVLRRSQTVVFRWLADQHWTVEYVSENISHYGYSSEDLVSGDIQFINLIHPEDLRRLHSELSEYRRLNVTEFYQEYRLVARSGQYRWVQDRTQVIRNASGKITHFQGLLMDITERKEALEDLRKREERFRLLFELAPNGMVICSTAGVVLRVNTAFCDMIGFEKHEVYGHRIGEFSTNPDLLADLSGLLISKHGAEHRSEQHFLRRNGANVTALVHMVLERDSAGEPTQVLVQTVDITARKLSEELLKSANFELDSFVYRASHDVRAPLRSIMGLVQLSRHTQEPEKKEEYLGLIERSIERLDSFVQDLLSYSSNARTELTVSRVDFDSVITTALYSLNFLIQERGCKVQVHCEADTAFYSDLRRVTVIAQNLLSNAIKYGVVKGKTHSVHISVHVRNDAAVMSISDEGPGIAIDQQERIFEMFYRADERSDGSGLGLYIVRSIVDRLGGTIQLASAPGKGTIVRIEFPNLLTS